MPTPILDCHGPRGLAYLSECLQRAGVEETAAARAAHTAHQRLAGLPSALDELEAQWYAALRARRLPDYSVYDDASYVAETYVCWIEYSRRYLHALTSLGKQPLLEALRAEVCSIADLGCGHGFTSAALRSIFPRATVCGTNRPQSTQWRVATVVGAEHGFDLAAESPPGTQMIFASEYFEHFDAPVDHLEDVLARSRPRWLLIANTFNSPGIGHFDSYRIDGQRVSGRVAGRAFNATLRAHGFVQVPTTFWNARPTCWRRASPR